ncbi:membrane bound O-acyl transferase family-domain-containing protein [Melanogaster broomeanus]|nr:membrane bound O-acyl transferase family-domain-containing protein [Melanogaster broomeanus]
MASFLTYILPVVACQYSMAVLVQLKGTQVYRLALLPIMLWFAWRASVSVNSSGGDPSRAMHNSGLSAVMFAAALRSIAWATAQEPYQRIDGNLPSDSQGSQDKTNSGCIFTALWNAWDLLLNPRGIGWNWSRGLILPKPAFEIRSRAAFVLWSAIRFAFYMLAFDATVHGVRAVFSPESPSSVIDGSIYDPSLPLVWQLLRCMTISGLGMLMGCFAMECCHLLLAMLCITAFQQHPSQWPPLFNSPWLATSLTDFWGRRWHQMIRHVLLMVGGRPFNFLFGRLGGVLGAFLLSGLLHVVELHAVGRGNFLIVVGFFTMNGVGVVLERVWKRVCGRSVGGIWGWIWTFSWMALWGVPLVDVWAKGGRFQKSVALVSFVRRYI